MVDSKVPSPVDSYGKEVKCLNWWIQVSNKYPTIFKLITTILSIFHGPQVESTFSKMDHMLDEKSEIWMFEGWMQSKLLSIRTTQIRCDSI